VRPLAAPLVRPAPWPLVATAVGVAAWQLLAQARLLPAFLVSPAAVAEQLGALAVSGELVRHAAASLYRSAAGLALGAGAGVALGLLAGVARPVAAFVDPLVALTYPVPKVALLPVLIVWFGIGDLSKVMVIAISCFYPCFVAALYGARAADPTWVWVAQSMGARPARTFFRVVLPAAAPRILGGLRVALALSFILMLASEMIGSSNRTGLGFLILAADASGRFDLMFAAIAVIAVLGFGADRALLGLRRVLAPATLAAEAAPGE
jgi:ABC-type nitrate/sulfonate/bicarbonate transport system permease component